MIEFKNGCLVNSDGEFTDIPDGKYYTVPELAKKLDVPQVRIRQWILRGNLTAVRCFGRNYIHENFTIGFSRTGKKMIRGVSRSDKIMHKSAHKFEARISV